MHSSAHYNKSNSDDDNEDTSDHNDESDEFYKGIEILKQFTRIVHLKKLT